MIFNQLEVFMNKKSMRKIIPEMLILKKEKIESNCLITFNLIILFDHYFSGFRTSFVQIVSCKFCSVFESSFFS